MPVAYPRQRVHEVTFVIQAGGRTVFSPDSLRVPELDTIPDRIGPPGLATLPANGPRIRPINLPQVVRHADQAAGLTAALKPAPACRTTTPSTAAGRATR